MKVQKLLLTIFMCSIVLPTGIVIADEDKNDYPQTYGWQLMTPQERDEHRMKMQSMKTEQERETYRKEHHEKMEKRAKERGMQLPDEPLERGRGMGPGGGMMNPDNQGRKVGPRDDDDDDRGRKVGPRSDDDDDDRGRKVGPRDDDDDDRGRRSGPRDDDRGKGGGRR